MQTYYTYNGINQSYIRNKRKPQLLQRKRVIRVAVVVLVLAFSFVFGAYINVFANSNEKVEAVPTTMTIHIHSGDSLWSIANAYAPKEVNTRSFMNEIMMLNELNNTNIYEGQLLQIPVK